MSLRALVSLAIVWVLSLFVVGSAVRAQFEIPRPLAEPRIVSGPDFGFRIEGDQSGTAIGKLVVRVDGKWIEARVAAVAGLHRIKPE